jgi:hypothetical protein
MAKARTLGPQQREKAYERLQGVRLWALESERRCNPWGDDPQPLSPQELQVLRDRVRAMITSLTHLEDLLARPSVVVDAGQ